MGEQGRWFVLFPSWRMPAPQAADAAVHTVSQSARIQGHGLGPFDVAEGEKSIGIGLDTAPHVLAESHDLAGTLEAKQDVRDWIGKCDARFVISFDLAHAVDLLNTIMKTGEVLRRLTGGATFDVQNEKLLDPPLDLLTQEDYAALNALHAFAHGGPAPPDLALQHYATNIHITMLTSAKVTGEVEIRSVMNDQPRAKAMANVEAIREAAKAFVASGFPKVEAPKAGPPPSPMIPPVRIGVVSKGSAMTAELPASNVSLVPSFSAAVTAIARLGDPVRRAQESLAGDLVRARDGQWPDALAIEVSFFANKERSFSLSLGPDGNIAEIEKRGTRERRSVLGAATPDEKKMIAQSILSAHFPFSHGTMRPVEGPHYRLRVAKGDAEIDVLVDAENVFKKNIAETVRLLYGAAVRFGKKPLELAEEPRGLSEAAVDVGTLFAENRENVADVTLLYLDGTTSSGWFASRIQLGADVKITLSHHPSAPGARRPDTELDLAKLAGMRVSLSSGGEKTFGNPPPPPAAAAIAKSSPRFAQEVLELVNGRIGFAAFARWLSEHKALFVPATPADGGFLPAVAEENGISVLKVFTSEGSLDAWIAAAGRPAAVMRDTGGAGLFGKMPENIGRVDVDPSAPITLQVHGDMLILLRGIARGVAVERACAASDAPGSAATILDHSFKVVWRPDPTPPPPPAVRNARLVSVPGPQGEPLAAAFSAEDSAFAFINASGGPSSGMTVATMTGRDLFASFQFLGVEGVSLNPSGPGARIVLTRDVCQRMLAAQ